MASVRPGVGGCFELAGRGEGTDADEFLLADGPDGGALSAVGPRGGDLGAEGGS